MNTPLRMTQNVAKFLKMEYKKLGELKCLDFNTKLILDSEMPKNLTQGFDHYKIVQKPENTLAKVI